MSFELKYNGFDIENNEDNEISNNDNNTLSNTNEDYVDNDAQSNNKGNVHYDNF